MDYEFLDITSDVMFRAYGTDEPGLFENAATAMFSVICDIDSVRPEKVVEISVTGDGLEELLFEWLSRLITESEIEEMFFSEFRVEGINKKDEAFKLKGWAFGENAAVEKGGTLVKGVTYYGFKIEKKEDKYVATVTLDI